MGKLYALMIRKAYSVTGWKALQLSFDKAELEEIADHLNSVKYSLIKAEVKEVDSETPWPV